MYNEFEVERVWELKNVVNGMNVKNSDTNEEENFINCQTSSMRQGEGAQINDIKEIGE